MPCVQIVKHDGILLSSIQEGLKPSCFCFLSKSDQTSSAVEHITHSSKVDVCKNEERKSKQRHWRWRMYGNHIMQRLTDWDPIFVRPQGERKSKDKRKPKKIKSLKLDSMCQTVNFVPYISLDSRYVSDTSLRHHMQYKFRLNAAFSKVHPRLCEDEALTESCCVMVSPCFCITFLHFCSWRMFWMPTQVLKSILEGKTLTGEFLKPSDPGYESQAETIF